MDYIDKKTTWNHVLRHMNHPETRIKIASWVLWCLWWVVPNLGSQWAKSNKTDIQLTWNLHPIDPHLAVFCAALYAICYVQCSSLILCNSWSLGPVQFKCLVQQPNTTFLLIWMKYRRCLVGERKGVKGIVSGKQNEPQKITQFAASWRLNTTL